MGKTFFLLVAAVIFLVAAAVSSVATPASAIWWGRSKVIETISPGMSKTAELVFTSKKDLGEVSLSASSDLSRFINQFQPLTLKVTKNEPFKVDVAFAIPLDTPLDTYGGTIHIRQGKRTIGKALAVNIKVVASQTPPPPTPPSSWTAPVDISHSPAILSYKAKILPDSLGNFYVLWRESDFNNYYKIMFSKWSSGSWSAPAVIVSGDRYNPLYDFDFAIDNQNRLQVVYVQRATSLGYTIYYLAFDGSNWTVPLMVHQGSVPSIDIGADNKIHLVYSGGNDIFYSTFDGSNWSAPLNVSNDGSLYTDVTSGARDIRVDGQGNVHIAWTKYNFGIMYTKFNGSKWSVPQLVSQLSPYPNDAYWLSLAGNNTVAVAYTRGPNDGLNQEIYFTFSSDNGVSWSDPVQISNTPGVGSRWPSLAVASPDDIQAVWGECQSGVPFRFFDGQNWSSIIDISSGTSKADFPNIIIKDNRSYVVWGSDNDIYFSIGQ